jgi:hypothetical protein
MCMQCMTGAVTAVGAASGTRAYVASRGFSWVTPRRLRALTATLAIVAVAASATLLGGTSSAPAQGQGGAEAQAPAYGR